MWTSLPWIVWGCDIVHSQIISRIVQFGWKWHNQTFSIEFEVKREGRCILTLDSEHREWPIKLQYFSTFIIAIPLLVLSSSFSPCILLTSQT